MKQNTVVQVRCRSHRLHSLLLLAAVCGMTTGMNAGCTCTPDDVGCRRQALCCFNKSICWCCHHVQDNEPLMRALSNLIALNEPDLVLFVGEALVGNDAVDQLVKFNRSLADLAPNAAMSELRDWLDARTCGEARVGGGVAWRHHQAVPNSMLCSWA